MADLYSSIGQNAQRVLTRSDNTGPETTWLAVNSGGDYWIGGESWSADATLIDSDSTNFRAIVECIQTYCEVYEVVRPGASHLLIKVRANSVPYAGSETAQDGNQNSILTALVHAHPGLGAQFSVWNGKFQGQTVQYD